MDLTQFISERRAGWKRLEQLLGRVEESGLGSLEEADAVSLGVLYRRAASDLNQAQTFVLGESTARYLNDLVARAYLAIHGRRGPGLFSGLVWLLRSYPLIFRRHLGAIGLATFLFAVGAVLGWLASRYDAAAARAYLLPAEMAVITPRAEGEADPTPVLAAGEVAAFSSFLFTHNLSVTLIAFALGLTLGVGTVWLMFANGMLLGVIGAVFAEAGQLGVLATGVLPHGVLEIPACLLGGASGLLLARGLLVARPWPRRQELARQGREALLLLSGCVPLLAAAAVLEAGVARAPDWVLGRELKLAVAATAAALFLLYVLLGARRVSPGEAPGAGAGGVQG